MKDCSKADSVQFVSTNDIIVSSFFNASKPDACLMQVNLRGRCDQWRDTDAGNYHYNLFYTSKSYGTPVQIRQSLQTQPYTRQPREPFPKPHEVCGKAAFISSW